MTLYLDTSSLVKLYVEEPGSDAVRALVRRAAVVATSDIAYPEARAALARRRRERHLAAPAFVRARDAFEADWPRYRAVGVWPAVCRQAGALAERDWLRGNASVHLAPWKRTSLDSNTDCDLKGHAKDGTPQATLGCDRRGAQRMGPVDDARPGEPTVGLPRASRAGLCRRHTEQRGGAPVPHHQCDRREMAPTIHRAAAGGPLR